MRIHNGMENSLSCSIPEAVFFAVFFFTIFMKIHMETVERLAEETDGFMILFLKFHFKLINIYSLYNYFFWMLYFNEFNELI